MNDIDKLVVVAKDGNATVLTGKAHIEIHDASRAEFKTKRMDAFVDFLNNFEDSGKNPVFASDRSCSMFDGDGGLRDQTPRAHVSIEKTNVIKAIESLGNGEFRAIETLESTLHSLLEYGDTDVVKLYQFTRNCNISAVTEFQRSFDDNGNYSLVVKREGKGDQKIRPVEIVNFTVPVLKMHKETCTFPFKVSMDYKTDGAIKVLIKLNNFQLQEQIDDAIKAIVDSHLSKLSGERKVYYGEYSVVKSDDSWKYKAL